MSFSDGITINGLHSHDDFNLSINAREIGLPEKRSVRKSVPFLNGFYDFSALNGSPSWGQREIKYTFDIIGETVEEMDEERMTVLAWLCNVHDADIFDDSIPDYHFHGSYDSYSMSEDGEHAELTVVFVCQPFMIGNNSIVQTFGSSKTATATFSNTGMPTRIIAETIGGATLSNGSISQFIPAGVHDYKTSFVADGITSVSVTMANEITMPYATSTTPATSNGITFTRGDDGKVTATGTATANAWFYFRGQSSAFKPRVGRHFVKCCTVDGGSASTFRINCQIHKTDGTDQYFYDTGNGVWVTVPENIDYMIVCIRIASGYTANNLVFDPEMYGELRLSMLKEVI